MVLHVYVDGSGKPRSMYGYYVKETGRARNFQGKDLTNNQAEYLAIKEALKDLLQEDRIIVVYSDSMNTVKQLSHEYAINDNILREMAIEIWNMISDKKADVKFEWIRRENNIAGKMLGS